MKQTFFGGKFVFRFFSAALLSVLGGAILFPLPAGAGSLRQEDLANLVKPGVVRIVRHTKGQITVPNFDIDLRSLTLNFVNDGQTGVFPADSYVTGSGFVVSQDGFILTNAHVGSAAAARIDFLNELLDRYIFQKLSSLTLQQQQDLESALSQNGLSDLTNGSEAARRAVYAMLDQLLARTKFDLTSELVVANPGAANTSLTELLAQGFPAKEAAANPTYYKDGKDVALLQVQQTALPVLQVGHAGSLVAGQKVYVFGFPSAAQISGNDLSESTFTAGTITAIKDSPSKQFQIYQTDAKVAAGSSGGPLLNENGEVVGIITYESNQLGSGDNFASAIPIDLAGQVLGVSLPPNDPGTYGQNFRAGLLQQGGLHCRAALQAFQAAASGNKQFQLEKFVAPYVQQCEELIASGQSLDNGWAEAWAYLKGRGWQVWFIVMAIGALILIIGGTIFFLRREVKSDEQNISRLQEEVAVEQRELSDLQTQSPAVPTTDSPVDPALAEYIKVSRATGVPDDQIQRDLRAAGWTEEQVQEALA